MTRPKFNIPKTDPLDTVMPFGKHQGRTLGEIGDEDPKYLDWLNGLDDLKPALKTAVEHACEHFSAEIEAAIGDD